MRKLALFATLCAWTLVSSAQSVHVNDSGTIRKAQRIYVNDASTIREIQRIYVNDGGTIRQVYINATYSLPTSASDAGQFGIDTIQAQIQLLNNGVWQQGSDQSPAGEGTGNWVTPTSLAPGAYTIRASVTSSDGGTLTGTVDSDLALTSNRTWALTPPSASFFTTVLALTLKDGGGNTVASGSATLTIDATL